MRRGLAPVLEGSRIVRARALRPDLRFPLPDGFGQMLTGRRVTAVGRRAKYLLVGLDNATTLIAHLGMSGSGRSSWLSLSLRSPQGCARLRPRAAQCWS